MIPVNRGVVVRRRPRGNAVIELALLAPWVFLLFLAIFNFGFFMYAGISVANAARVASLEMGRRAANRLDQSLACSIIKEELKYLPNASQFPATCNAAPLTVVVNSVDGLDQSGSPNAVYLAAQVRVTYQSVQLFPLPWLMGRLTLTRQADIRVYE